MKKKAIAIMLSMMMAVSSAGGADAFVRAAETTAEEAVEITQEEAMEPEISDENSDIDTGLIAEDADRELTAPEEEEESAQEAEDRSADEAGEETAQDTEETSEETFSPVEAEDMSIEDDEPGDPVQEESTDLDDPVSVDEGSTEADLEVEPSIELIEGEEIEISKEAAAATPPIGVSDSYASGTYYSRLCSTLDQYANASQRDRFVAVALSQKGYTDNSTSSNLSGNGDAKGLYVEYTRLIGGFGSDWCAGFVSWCGRMAGLPEEVIPTKSGAGDYRTVGTEHKICSDDFSTFIPYKPKVGDIVLWMPYHDGCRASDGGVRHYNAWKPTSHVSIVASVNETPDANGAYTFTTIERNGHVVGSRTLKTNAINSDYYTCPHEDINPGKVRPWLIQKFVTPNWQDMPADNNLPAGNLEDCSGGGRTVTVKGWAYDPDEPSKSIEVHVYIGGPAGEGQGQIVNANKSRPDVNSALGITGNHGFEATIDTSKTGTQNVYIYAMDSNGRDNLLMATKTINISSNRKPAGNLEECNGGAGTISVKGWAYDPDEPSKSIEVHVYVGGPAGEGEGHAIVANILRSDVNKERGITGNHGFEATIDTSKTGSQNVYIYAIDTSGSDHLLMATKTINISSNKKPVGKLDDYSGGIGTVTVKGWAYDPNEPSKSIEVHVYVGGPAGVGEGHNIATNVLRKDVNSEYGLSGNHGYDATITTSKTGSQNVYIYAIDTAGGDNTELGKVTVNITEPKDLSNAVVTLDKTEYTYTGTEIRPVIKSVKYGSETLTEGTDYSVSYKDNINPTSSAYVIIKGNGTTTINSKNVSFKITKADQVLSADGLKMKSGESRKIVVDGAKGALTYKSADTKVAQVASDGTVTAVSAGTTTITITAAATTGYNAASINITVQVVSTAVDVSELEVTVNDDGLVYNGEAKTPGVTVKHNGTTVTKGYTVEYRNNVEAGLNTAEAVIKGDGVSFTGTKIEKFTILPGKTTRGDMFNLANNVKVTWKEAPGAKYYKVYRIGVTDPSESLDEPVIVTERLIGWDQQPGLTNGHAYRYRIVASLTGRGDSSGDSPLSYSKLMYRLKTVVIRSVKNNEPGKVTVKYDKTTSGDSYVLQYCEREDMVGAKTKVVLGANNTSYTIGGLKKGKTYYISIRVRKKVNGIDYYTTFGVAKKITITK